MTVANGSAVKYYYTVETAGEIAATAPAFLPIRFNSANLSRSTAQVDSGEIGSRQRPVAKQGTYSVQGEIASELSDASFDALLEMAMQSTWATNTLKVGSTVQTISILERHTDTGEDYVYSNCRINTVAVSASVDARVAITFGVIGADQQEYTVPGDATFATAGTSEPMVTSVGSITEGGSALAYATAYDFTLNNGMSPIFALAQRSAYDVSNGMFTVTGNLSAYAPDGTLYAKFLNETDTTLAFQCSDGANTMTFTFPAVIYTQAEAPVAGDGALISSYTFSAGYDATAVTTVTITRSA